MADRKEIDQRHLDQANALEAEFFDIVPDGVGQRRVLKEGKSIEEFNLKHSEIWRNHEAELIAGGYLTLPKPPRNLEAEIDVLKTRIEKLEKK